MIAKNSIHILLNAKNNFDDIAAAYFFDAAKYL